MNSEIIPDILDSDLPPDIGVKLNLHYWHEVSMVYHRKEDSDHSMDLERAVDIIVGRTTLKFIDGYGTLQGKMPTPEANVYLDELMGFLKVIPIIADDREFLMPWLDKTYLAFSKLIEAIRLNSGK